MRPGGSGSFQTDRTYTGQKADGTGLLYYNARYYDSALGLFLSPDTIVPDAGVVVDYNRFLYVRRNPLRYVDPSGRIAVCFKGGPENNEENPQSAFFNMCTEALSAAGYNEEKHGKILEIISISERTSLNGKLEGINPFQGVKG